MADEDFDEDIYDDEGEIDTGVQLGFMSETKNLMFSDPNWEHWDGGKVGGKPVWLNSVRIPSPSDMKCVCCNSPMVFLLQIYCPLDDVEDAFHRALYIFICKKKICVDNGSVKCFRTQMNRKNDTYAYDPKTIEQKGKEEKRGSALQLPKLCALCGCRAPSMCSQCRRVSYCCREHQSADWRDHKQHCHVIAAVVAEVIADGTNSDSTPADLSANATTSKATATADIAATTPATSPTITDITATTTGTAAAAESATNTTNSAGKLKNCASTTTNNILLFPEFNLSISAEILEDLEKVDALNKSVLEASIWENAGEPEIDDCSDDEDEEKEKADKDLTQTDYNAALGNEASDTVYTKFMERVRRGGSNQVLRYIRWDEVEGPLAFSSSDLSTGPQGSSRLQVSDRDLGPSIPGLKADLGPLIPCSGADLAPPTPPSPSSAPITTSESLAGRGGAGCCSNCGAKRKFEFQIMPQLLHFLRVDRRTKISVDTRISVDDSMPCITEGDETGNDPQNPSNNLSDDPKDPSNDLNGPSQEPRDELLLQNKAEEDLDWGTIDVYTCSGSCSVRTDKDSAYLLESTYTQKPLLFVRTAKPAPPGTK